MATTAETLRRTNENPGTRAILRNCNLSPYKVRAVLDLIRGEDVQTAIERLRFCERAPAVPVAKLLNSAIANAENNDSMLRDELFVTTAFADEGVTAKRWRPRARGRAGRIRKRSSHITIVLARLPEDRLEQVRARNAEVTNSRSRRVSGSRADRVAGGRNKAAAQEVNDEAVADAANEEVETTEMPTESDNTAVDNETTTTDNEATAETESTEVNESTEASDSDAKEEGK